MGRKIPLSGGGEVCRCGRYQKMETKFQGVAEIKTREGAAAERSAGGRWQKMEMQVSVRSASYARRRARSGGGKVGRRAVAKNGNASFCEVCELCETESAVRRLGGYQKMETKFQGAAEIKTREGAAAERSAGERMSKNGNAFFGV